MPTPTTNMVDSSVEINQSGNDLSFKAEYDPSGNLIQIMYRHDFPAALRLSTSSIVWVSMDGI